MKADIDAYLLDETGKPIAGASSTENNVGEGSQTPFELLGWENPGAETEVQLVVNRCFSSAVEAENEEGCNPFADPSAKPRLKLILIQNGGGVKKTEYLESAGGDTVGPSIYGHAGTASAVTVGAIQAGVTDKPESYSSRGPVHHYFGPVADGPISAVPPAPPLEATIAKPDVIATDCGRTTFFASKVGGVYRFCGTSAAAPHAAAVAALVRQANPALTPGQVQAGLAATARAVGTFGPEAVGAGLIDAHRLIEDLALPPSISITEAPQALSKNRQPSIGFGANRPVAFECSLDGAPPLPCASPYHLPNPVKDGLHGFAVRGQDLAGRVGVSATAYFTVDTTPPQTSFRIRPRKRLLRTRRRRAKAVFRFASSEPGSKFACRVDGGLVHFCAARFARRFGPGRHVLRAMAIDRLRQRRQDSGDVPLPGQADRSSFAPPRADCRRRIRWPASSSASSAAPLPRTSGSVRLSPSRRVPK